MCGDDPSGAPTAPPPLLCDDELPLDDGSPDQDGDIVISIELTRSERERLARAGLLAAHQLDDYSATAAAMLRAAGSGLNAALDAAVRAQYAPDRIKGAPNEGRDDLPYLGTLQKTVQTGHDPISDPRAALSLNTDIARTRRMAEMSQRAGRQWPPR
jgi:hypothetical protein